MAKKENSENNSKEFLEKKELLELQNKFDIEKHGRWMEGLKFQRETENIHHDHEMQRQRIKTAEIKKAQDRKADRRFVEKYAREQQH